MIMMMKKGNMIMRKDMKKLRTMMMMRKSTYKKKRMNVIMMVKMMSSWKVSIDVRSLQNNNLFINLSTHKNLVFLLHSFPSQPCCKQFLLQEVCLITVFSSAKCPLINAQCCLHTVITNTLLMLLQPQTS